MEIAVRGGISPTKVIRNLLVMKTAKLGLMMVVMSFCCLAQTSPAVQPNFHVKQYKLKLAFNPVAQNVSGAVTVFAESRESGLNEVRLNLADAMKVHNVSMADR